MVFKRNKLKWYERTFLNTYFLNFFGIIAIVLYPSFIGFRGEIDFYIGTAWLNSLISNGSAYFLSVIFLFRMRRYPGVRSFFWILPSTILAWALVLSMLLLLREDYSRKTILLSFCIASFLYIGTYFLVSRYMKVRLAIVPFGGAVKLLDCNNFNVRELRYPSLLEGRYDGVVVDLYAHDLTPDWERFLAKCTLAGVPVYHYKQVLESLSGRVNIEHLSENIFGELQPSRGYAFIKRLIDLFCVLVTMPVWLPVMFITGLLVKLDSFGPMFFVQKRVGQGGREFKVYKLRSMTVDSEKNGAQFAQKNDARVTSFGKFIRKTRLDEFPQFINVLKGQMSLIGPRPEQRIFVEKFEDEIPFYSYRHIVKPGITGWAQVTQGYAADAEDTKVKIEHDFYYIKNFSLWLDILIVIKTIKTMLTGFGAR